MAKNKCECKPGLPGWLATFADLMSLLLCFFILLLAFSSTEIIKFRRAVGSLKGAFGVLPHEVTVVKKREIFIPKLSDSQNKRVKAAVQRIKSYRKGMEGRKDKKIEKAQQKKIQEKMKKMFESDQVKLQITTEGIAIRIANDMLFSSGKANLNSEIFELLDLVVDVSKGWPNKIKIEGHTDNIPINTRKYPSNWELSSARAISVAKYFITQGGISPEKISASGSAEFKPLAANNSEENRRKNRRVEIFINYDDKIPDNISKKFNL
jgi:chemotaxis protein MotB